MCVCSVAQLCLTLCDPMDRQSVKLGYFHPDFQLLDDPEIKGTPLPQISLIQNESIAISWFKACELQNQNGPVSVLLSLFISSVRLRKCILFH